MAVVLGLVAVLHAAPSVLQAAQPTAEATVSIDTFQFKPSPLEAKTGTRVVWTNNDDVTHTVTSGTPDRRTGLFNSTLGGKGVKFEFTFTRAGTYAYFCSRHPHMRGEITVQD
jgi:plastocyanin